MSANARPAAYTPDSEKLRLCRGCDSDFYNGKNPLGVARCWHLASARVVTRFKLGWWTLPATPGAFEKVQTLGCHTESGRYAFYEKPPAFAVGVR